MDALEARLSAFSLLGTQHVPDNRPMPLPAWQPLMPQPPIMYLLKHRLSVSDNQCPCHRCTRQTQCCIALTVSISILILHTGCCQHCCFLTYYTEWILHSAHIIFYHPLSKRSSITISGPVSPNRWYTPRQRQLHNGSLNILQIRSHISNSITIPLEKLISQLRSHAETWRRCQFFFFNLPRSLQVSLLFSSFKLQLDYTHCEHRLNEY